MKKSLFEITSDYSVLMQTIEENEGVLSDEQSAALSITEDELQNKSKNYIEFIGDRSSFVSRIDDEIKRLQALKKVNVNLTTRLKDSLLMAVEMFGAFEVGLHKIGSRKSEALIIDDDFKCPDQFKKIKIDIDKAGLKKAIKDGETFSGARVQEKQNLSIK